jgi:hypothetical protein
MRDLTISLQALADDGRCAVVYLPTPRPFMIDLTRLNGPVTGRWFDSTRGDFQPVEGSPFANTGRSEFTSPARNAAGQSDWVLSLEVTR